MTIEEAIDILTDIRDDVFAPMETEEMIVVDELERKALSMAIKSLEAWDKVEADILGLDGYSDDAFWEGTYAVSKIIGKHLAEVTK